MLIEAEVRKLAGAWIEAWNSHNLDAILSHYAEDVVLISPTAAKLLQDPTGRVAGKAALRSYFSRGLEVYPNLTFELLDVLWGVSSLLLYYKNQNGSKTAEFMELDSSGRVARVTANYSA